MMGGLGVRALCLPQLKRYEKAVEWARKAAQVPDTLIPRISVVKISALGHLGRREEARSVADELLGVKPDFTLDYVMQTFPFEVNDLDHLLESLRRAGLSE